MPRSSRLVNAGKQAQPGAWGRSDTVLFALAATNLALIVVQFALAGFGAFAMDKSPSDNAYAAHAVLGLIIAALTMLILAATLAGRNTRAHLRSLRLAVALAVLAVALQPVLGDTGKHAPVLGALHALNAVIILALACWLTAETRRRRAASQATQTVTRGRAAS